MRCFFVFIGIVAFAISCGFSNAQESPSPAEEQSSISPDKKWEYVGGEEPKIVKAGTNDVARHLPDQGPGDVVGRRIQNALRSTTGRDAPIRPYFISCVTISGWH